jgi:hypothetical protein
MECYLKLPPLKDLARLTLNVDRSLKPFGVLSNTV